MKDKAAEALFNILAPIGTVVEIKDLAGNCVGKAIKMPAEPGADQTLKFIFLEGEGTLHLHSGFVTSYFFLMGTGRLAVASNNDPIFPCAASPGVQRWIPAGIWHAAAALKGTLVFAEVLDPAPEEGDFDPHPEYATGWSALAE